MRFRDRFLAHLIYLFYKYIYRTYRVKVENPWWENPEIDQTRPVVVAHWHEDDMGLIGYYAPMHFHVIVSLSRDGRLLSYVMEKLGCVTVRGSSSRGGARALLEMIKALRGTAGIGAITVDGPRGPRHVAKPGVIALAKKIDGQLVTLSAGARRRFVLRGTWSRTYLPLPFTAIHHIVSRTPVDLPKDESDEAYARVLREIEERLTEDHRRIAERFGRGLE